MKNVSELGRWIGELNSGLNLDSARFMVRVCGRVSVVYGAKGTTSQVREFHGPVGNPTNIPKTVGWIKINQACGGV